MPGTNESVTFGLKTPDGAWEIRKKYKTLRWAEPNAPRDADPIGYQLDVELLFKNLNSKEQSLVYDFEGPVGVPLENAEHTSKFRDVKYGIREASGSLVTGAVTIGDLIKAANIKFE